MPAKALDLHSKKLDSQLEFSISMTVKRSSPLLPVYSVANDCNDYTENNHNHFK